MSLDTSTAVATGSDHRELLLTPEPPADWARLWLTGATHDEAVAKRALLARMPSGTLFGLLRNGDESAALGLLVIEGCWGGLFGMATEPRFRRRGLAMALLGAFAKAAGARGATSLYLQVEQDNPAALALYHRTGFTLAYAYHYRKQDTVSRRP